MRPRVTKLISLLFAVILILSACSGSESSTSNGENRADKGNDKASSDSNNKVTIVYSVGKETGGIAKKEAKAFEKKHPNIHVKIRVLPNDSGKQHDTYVTSLSSKSSDVDVIDMDVVWAAEFAQAGYIIPLDRFIQRDHVDLDMYNKGALSAGKVKGKQWAIQLYMDVGTLFYRKDIVDQPPKTWDELIKQAKNNQGKKGTKFGYAFQGKQYEGLVTDAIEFINAYGGRIIKDDQVVVNNKKTIKGLKKLVEIANSDFVPKNITSFEEPETDTAFIKGNAVFVRNWPFEWGNANDKKKSDIAGKVGVAPLPKGDAGSSSALGGWMLGINKYSKHKKEAWKFLKFLSGKEGQKLMAIDSGRAPTIMSLYNDKDVLKANPFFAKKGFQEALKNAVPRPVVPNYQKVSDIIQTHVSNAIAKKETPKEAVEGMEKELKDAMD